jgi:hypothetical protein
MRKLAILTALAVAAMAMTATSAMAATEVRDAATGQLCSNVSPAINKTSPPVVYRNTGTPSQGTQPSPYLSGGCTTKLTMTAVMTSVRQPGWSEPRQCNVSYDLHLGPDGWGYANNFVWGSSGANCSSWRTPGSRIVMPKAVTPTFGGMPLYTAADAATDLNMELWATDALGNNHHGFLSLDVYVPQPGQPFYGASLIVKNQQTTSSFLGHGFQGGYWSRLNVAGSSVVTITH